MCRTRPVIVNTEAARWVEWLGAAMRGERRGMTAEEEEEEEDEEENGMTSDVSWKLEMRRRCLTEVQRRSRACCRT
jgi:hypothetical protein